MTRLSTILIPGSVAFVAACGPSNNFVPEQASTTVGGDAATVIAIPPEAPRGEVRIASSGLTTLRASDAPDLPAVHVRLVVSNDADTATWTVDTRQQLLSVRGTNVAPAFASSERGGLPLVTIQPREQRSIDLYYPVADKSVDQFELGWQVQTGERLVGQRTAFFRTEPDSGPVYADAWGPYWWYDPFFPRYHVYVSGRVIGHRGHGWVVRGHRRG